MKHRAIIFMFSLQWAWLFSCQTAAERSSGTDGAAIDNTELAREMEESLFSEILEHWYPLNIDTVQGGYISVFKRDWRRPERPEEKALVQQARHVWTTSFIYEHYPEREEYLDYAEHGYRFLRDAMWDMERGGFHGYCNEDGSPSLRTLEDKRVYGQAFALYGLSQYYRASGNEEALELARKEFFWMEEHAHDPRFGGYFEILDRNGDPVSREDSGRTGQWDFRATGLKDYNSSIHLMEALTSLYRVWPDSLVRARLEEMFILVRDTFVHPDGYLRLYFYPEWRLVPEPEASAAEEREPWFTHHFTYGHDVETAYLLLETARELGWGEDEKTHWIAKKLVDHSLESGWDSISGGFFDAGKDTGEEIRITNRHKSWWGQAEGLNALLLMHTLHPGDAADYYGKFLTMWEYIDRNLIDKEYGGWYNNGLDTFPGNRDQPKSHIWKTTYHNSRALVHCIDMLRDETE